MKRIIGTALRITVIATLAAPFAALAEDSAPPETLAIKAFPDRYVAAGKSFTNLAALETWAKPILIRSVWLDFCFPASTQEVVSAVGRVHAAYAGHMRVRTLAAGEGACAQATGTDPSRAVESIPERDYLATDESGRSLLP